MSAAAPAAILPPSRPPGGSAMRDTQPRRLSAVDLRRMAAATPDAERERKMLALADVFEEAERSQNHRSEEHTSELQSRRDLVCRLLLEKKKKKAYRQPQTRKTPSTQKTK